MDGYELTNEEIEDILRTAIEQAMGVYALAIEQASNGAVDDQAKALWAERE